MIEYIRRSHDQIHLRHQTRRKIKKEEGVIKKISKTKLHGCMSKPKHTGLLCAKDSKDPTPKFDEYLNLEKEKLKKQIKTIERCE